jgi:hypothetical protein
MEIRTYKTIIRPIIIFGSETWTDRENCIHSDDLRKKDYKENLCAGM